jgi:SHS2 domain-containing protein
VPIAGTASGGGLSAEFAKMQLPSDRAQKMGDTQQRPTGRDQKMTEMQPERATDLMQKDTEMSASPAQKGTEMSASSAQKGTEMSASSAQKGTEMSAQKGTEMSASSAQKQTSGARTSSEPTDEPIGRGAESGRHVEYEYLPHPADVQFHSWGVSKSKAFENMADCMFNYLANTQKVAINPRCDFDIHIAADDDKDLLYKFLDELLFRFNSRKQVICKRVSVNRIERDPNGGSQLYAICHGEQYDPKKHGAGTEIKAITLASLEVNEQPGRTEAFAIVDI